MESTKTKVLINKDRALGCLERGSPGFQFRLRRFKVRKGIAWFIPSLNLQCVGLRDITQDWEKQDHHKNGYSRSATEITIISTKFTKSHPIAFGNFISIQLQRLAQQFLWKAVPRKMFEDGRMATYIKNTHRYMYMCMHIQL